MLLIMSMARDCVRLSVHCVRLSAHVRISVLVLSLRAFIHMLNFDTSSLNLNDVRLVLVRLRTTTQTALILFQAEDIGSTMCYYILFLYLMQLMRGEVQVCIKCDGQILRLYVCMCVCLCVCVFVCR